MKSYTITVNGTAYEVTVEETGSVSAPAAAPKAAPKAAPAAAPKAGDSVIILESMKMEIPVVAPQDGTIASIDVAEGASVENGDTLATMN